MERPGVEQLPCLDNRDYIGFYRDYVGIIKGLYRDYIGTRKGLCKDYIGIIKGLYRHYMVY